MHVVIARGWKFEIYQDSQDTVCKLYELGYSPQRVQTEFSTAKKVYALGKIPMARCEDDWTRHRQYYGQIREQVVGGQKYIRTL